MTKLFSHLILTFIFAVAISSCGDKRATYELSEINSLANSISSADSDYDKHIYHKADSLLSDIDTSKLSERDRLYHSLLKVKINDKAYIQHSTDSIIRPVVEYAANHKNCGFYQEALYYAGRVYSDLGDSFSAISYYHEALENTSETEINSDLKCRILCQLSSLLRSLRLYKEAITIAEDCVLLHREMKDSINLFYDFQDLAYMELQLKEFDKSESLLSESMKYSSHVLKEDSLLSIIYLAGVKESKGMVDSALHLIRGIPEQINSASLRNVALAFSSDIYRKAGLEDTAWLYARKIVNSNNPKNKLKGYQNIFKSDKIANLAKDTILHYVNSYTKELQRYLNSNGDQLTLMQQAKYNYSIHDRERAKAEKNSSLYAKLLIVTSFLVLLTIIVILILQMKRKQKIIELQKANVKINSLLKQMDSIDSKNAESITVPFTDELDVNSKEYKEKHLEDYKEELLTVAKRKVQNKEAYVIPTAIKESQVYNELTKQLDKAKFIQHNDILWNKLEKTVSKACPDFKRNFKYILGGKVSNADLQTAILIKCGVSPSEMASALSLSLSAISQRRQSISIKIFDRNVGSSVIDAIIQNL